MDKKEIKERANKILDNNKINILSDEKEIIEILNKILNGNDEDLDFKLLNKTLDNIEIYIKTKEKMKLAKDDYIFLSDISSKLKKQTIRRTDGVLYTPIFKVKDKDGIEKYFLTREGTQKYIETNKGWNSSNIIEINEHNNSELLKIIEIIQKNF